MIISLMLLNLAGGESVSDLDLLEKDRGLCRMFQSSRPGMRLSERTALEKRWRVERRRSVPSESAVFRFWRGSMTRARSRCGKLTEHSYLLPMEL